MTLGQRIKQLRTEKGLTQKDLSEKVNVTFQTVSKWENDENEPDVATLKELAKLFGCSMDDLLSEEDHKEEAPKEPEQAPVKTVTETIVIHQKEMHVCERCKKDIPEGELEMEEVCIRHAGRGRHAEYRTAYYHKDCLAETKKEREEAERNLRSFKASRAKKLSFGWGIAGGIAALAIALVIVLMNPDVIHPAVGVPLSIFIGYAIFATIYCIITGSYIALIFFKCATASIRFPGVIFSWSIEGFVWAIAIKILFAILGFLFGVVALIFGTALSGVLSAISFPFVLIHNIHTEYGDSFTN